MSKRILIFQGSPRKKKNTATLTQEFIRGAEETGNEVTLINVTDYAINGCIDCKHCLTHEGVCSQKDGMQDIYKLLHQHDMLVLATPVYFFGMTSQVKAPLDRMFAGIGKPFSIDSMALLVTFQDSNESIVQPLLDQYKIMTSFCQYEDKGIVYASGLNSDEDIKQHHSLEKAYELGKSVS